MPGGHYKVVRRWLSVSDPPTTPWNSASSIIWIPEKGACGAWQQTADHHVIPDTDYDQRSLIRSRWAWDRLFEPGTLQERTGQT